MQQCVSNPLPGRTVLGAIGLNTLKLLAASADQFCGVVSAGELVDYVTEERDHNYRVMESMFHADGEKTEENDGRFDGECCDSGGKMPAE